MSKWEQAAAREPLISNLERTGVALRVRGAAMPGLMNQFTRANVCARREGRPLASAF